MKMKDLLKEFESFVSKYGETYCTLCLKDEINKKVLVEELESIGYKNLKLSGWSTDYMEVENIKRSNMSFLVWQKGSSISWPDDDRQPSVGERLFKISFPTGAFMFSDNYEHSKNIFNDFFKELKSYNPIYMDSVNHNLFWDIKDGYRIYSDYENIYEKYRLRVEEAIKKYKIIELESELVKLKEK